MWHCIVMSGCIEMSDAVLHFLPSAAHENNRAQSTAYKCPSSPSHFFSPFNHCSSVLFCGLIKGISRKICTLYFVLINSILWNLSCTWLLFCTHIFLSLSPVCLAAHGASPASLGAVPGRWWIRHLHRWVSIPPWLRHIHQGEYCWACSLQLCKCNRTLRVCDAMLRICLNRGSARQCWVWLKKESATECWEMSRVRLKRVWQNTDGVSEQRECKRTLRVCLNWESVTECQKCVWTESLTEHRECVGTECDRMLTVCLNRESVRECWEYVWTERVWQNIESRSERESIREHWQWGWTERVWQNIESGSQ